MAAKRCFSNTVIDSDDFFDLSSGAKLLYFHLGMKTDDVGFLSGYKKIISQCGQSLKELQELEENGFIIRFKKCLVITHHNVHNKFRSDREPKTDFHDELQKLGLANQVYYLLDEDNSNSTQHKEPNQTEQEQNSTELNGKSTQLTPSGMSTDTQLTPNGMSTVNQEEWNRICSLFLNSRGLSAVSDAQKHDICEIGYDRMSTAIDNYKSELSRNSWMNPMNASTFFNERYVEYLEENYTPDDDLPFKTNDYVVPYSQRVKSGERQ